MATGVGFPFRAPILVSSLSARMSLRTVDGNLGSLANDRGVITNLSPSDC